MKNYKLKLCIFLFAFLSVAIFLNTLCISNTVLAKNESLELQSKSVVLIEASTGTILYEKEKDVKLNLASITKIMTLILIYEAIEKNTYSYENIVTVSEHAASMGGSQVFLEVNETQTVKDMIKCITIASANDACVAMAEYTAGSETEFVNKMNDKAKELGMNNTNFVNCCGLDVENHYSSAYDVAIMSKELITKHPQVMEFSTTWMDSIIHKTKKGESEFGLTNTNKLVRTYEGITGLKTGSTNLAKYCLAASAKRNDIDLIAVVMSAPEHKLRYTEAAKLLDYGFANCRLYKKTAKEIVLDDIKIKKGLSEKIKIKVAKDFSYVLTGNNNDENISYQVKLSKKIIAPVKKESILGKVTFKLDNEEIGNIDILAAENIKKAEYIDYFYLLVKKYLLNIM